MGSRWISNAAPRRGDDSADWAYNRALLAFRDEGDSERARKLLVKAGEITPAEADVHPHRNVLVPVYHFYDYDTTTGTYDPATYPVFDRALALSTNNQRDGGMQIYLNVAGGAPAPATTLSASDKSYSCYQGMTLSITDPAKGVLAGAVGANGAVLGTTTAVGTLSFHSDGTFRFTATTSLLYELNFWLGTAFFRATVSITLGSGEFRYVASGPLVRSSYKAWEAAMVLS